MLKWQKKDILEITDVLRLAHDEIRKVIKLSRFDILSELSAACIECAESINKIVSDEEITKAVSEYISSKSPADDKLDILISIIENTPVKKEILFLPYNASMWDSFHTVYLAAKADKNSEVFVVPIPYVTLIKENVKAGEVHCDIDKLPKDVVVTHYSDYNIEKRCPDIIFIHNPYDFQNNTTRISEKYFSYNIKKYTGLLVYIPYFISKQKIDEDLALLQGVLFADKVIVESEDVRKMYMDVLLQHRAEVEEDMDIVCDEHYVENKFTALGSPKLELASKSKREDFDIPDEWLSKIQKPDGSYKKIVLYNTSIKTMLYYSVNDKEKNISEDDYLKKIENVFEIFKSRDDILLWWRPHPLLADNIKSLRPNQYDRYKKIVENFIAGGFGIYDDSSDLDRAVAWSDLCYGDASSIKELFAVSNKPMLLQDPRTKGFMKYLGHMYTRMNAYNNKLYFMSRLCNIIFEFDIKTGKTNYFGMIPDLPICSSVNFLSVQVIESKMYIIPINSPDIYVYDFILNKYETIHLELQDEFIGENKDFFNSIFVYKDRLFFLPRWYKSMVWYDINTKETHHFCSVNDICSTGKKANMFNYSYAFSDEHTILLSAADYNDNSTALLTIELDSLTISIDYEGVSNSYINNIFKIENDIYLKDGLNLFVYRKLKDEYINISDVKNNNLSVLSATLQTVKCGKYIYIVCNYPLLSYKINAETGEYKEFHAFDEYYSFNKNADRYEFHVNGSAVIGNKIYFMHNNNNILEFDTVTEQIREIPIVPTYSEQDIRNFDNILLGNIVGNREFAGIDYKPSDIVNVDHAGQAIFNYCKGLIE
jgi:hypothetical protein